MSRLLLAGLVLFSSALPGSVSALTMLDPGGSAVNPIYVQDVTPPQLKKPAETPSYPRPKLQDLQPTPMPTAPVFVPAQRPTVIYVNDPAPAPALTLSNEQLCKNNYGQNSVWTGQLNAQGGAICGCAAGYDWNNNSTACVILAVTYVAPSEGSSAANSPAPKVTACAEGQTRASNGACTSYERACVIDFGPRSTWTGQLNETGGGVCGCEEGYQTSPETKSCIALPDQVAAVTEAVGALPSTELNWWQRFLQWLGL